MDSLIALRESRHAAFRDRHFGLARMHERANLAGGKLVIWSKLDSGTDVELTIPASLGVRKIAFGAPVAVPGT